MVRALLSSIDLISLDDVVVSVKSAMYICSICTETGSCPSIRKLILAFWLQVLPIIPIRDKASKVPAQCCLRQPRRFSKTLFASGKSLPIKMDTSLSSFGLVVPFRCGHSRLSSVRWMLQKLEDCLFDNKAFAVRLMSSPGRWIPLALTVVKANDIGDPLMPNSSTRGKDKVILGP